MVTRYQVSLNGNELHDIADSVIIRDVQEKAMALQMNTLPIGRGNGLRVTRSSRDSLTITVMVEVHEYGIEERTEVINRMALWARSGGILKANHRKDQQIYVKCTELPTVASALKWTDVIRLTFVAFENPFWESANEKTVTTANLSSSSGTLNLDGDGDNVLISADVVAGGSLNTLTISVNGRSMSFEGLGIGNGGVLSIGYNNDGIQYIRQGGMSKMACRMIDSVDDLLANVGSNSFSVSANVPVRVTLKARGVFI